MKSIFFSIFLTLSLIFSPTQIHAENKTFPATIVNIQDPSNASQSNKTQWLELKNHQTDQNLFIRNEQSPYFKFTEYKVGEELMITLNEDTNDYQITDYYRQKPINLLFWIFVITVLAIGKLYGLTSILGMFLSLAVIIKIILPQISSGTNPILVIIIASVFLIPTTFYLSHGINTKTNLAIIGTFISAIVTGILAYAFTHLSHITGYANEEANFLDVAKNGQLNIQSLLIAGIIIGSIGILDDVSVSQVSVVNEIAKANPKFGFFDLFKRSMSVGRDHVASMVNTLFLVYTGAAMPLMLLFLDSSVSFNQIINTEIVAEEIVRTLVASIGLILAVPTTTFMAANYYSKNKNRLYNQDNSHSHHH